MCWVVFNRKVYLFKIFILFFFCYSIQYEYIWYVWFDVHTYIRKCSYSYNMRKHNHKKNKKCHLILRVIVNMLSSSLTLSLRICTPRYGTQNIWCGGVEKEQKIIHWNIIIILHSWPIQQQHIIAEDWIRLRQYYILDEIFMYRKCNAVSIDCALKSLHYGVGGRLCTGNSNYSIFKMLFIWRKWQI